jgi:hypothetical protein
MKSGLIKGFARNFRDGGWKSALGFHNSQGVGSKVRGLDEIFPQNPNEIHILLGSDRVAMAMCMVASWILSTQQSWKLVFHDDGSLTQNDLSKIQWLFRTARVISTQESDSVVRDRLESLPLCWKCRNIHPLCRKLFDFPIFSHSKRNLPIDTDILFYKTPSRLLEWLGSEEETSLFMRDVEESTLPSAVDAAHKIGSRVQTHVNTGIVGVPKPVICFETIERCLKDSRLLDENRWFIEQSLYAILASRSGKVELLDTNKYQLNLSGPLSANAVCRHYVGKVRHLLYSEGVPLLLKMIKNQKAK